MPLDLTERLLKLAEALSRKFSAVRLRMNNRSWIMSEHGLSVVREIPQLFGVSRKVVAVVLDVWAELEAEESGAPDVLWTEEQLHAALTVYRELLAEVAGAGRDADVDDFMCHLSQQSVRLFAPCRRCLVWIVALARERDLAAPGGLQPEEDMPPKTRVALERLKDGVALS